MDKVILLLEALIVGCFTKCKYWMVYVVWLTCMVNILLFCVYVHVCVLSGSFYVDVLVIFVSISF